MLFYILPSLSWGGGGVGGDVRKISEWPSLPGVHFILEADMRKHDNLGEKK